MSHFSEISKECRENYDYANSYWSPYVEKTKICTLAASGYTWSDKERQMLSQDGREPIEFNIMRRPLEFFSGYLRDNINEIIYSPVEGSDQKTADQFSTLSYHIWDKGKGFTHFLNAADECFKSGIALCGIQMDYSKDFINGDISFFKREYNSFFLDPTFSQIDLQDCGFAITRDLLGKSQLKQLLPFLEDGLIDDLPASFKDSKFNSYTPQFAMYGRNKDIVCYDQYYRRTSRNRVYLVDLSTAFYKDISDVSPEKRKTLEFGLKRLKKMRRDFEEQGLDIREIPNFEIQNVERPFVELNIILNGECVYNGEDKTGVVETYPFAPLICYLEPSIWDSSQRLQGISASLWSLNRQFNKRHMKIIDMMDSDISTGYAYMIGSVPNPDDLRQKGQNKIIGIDPEGAPGGIESALKELHGGGTNPAIIEYQRILDELSMTLANVTESSMGIDEKGNTQISGKLAQVRIAQGLRGNRKIFDNIEDAQQIIGGLILKSIQTQYPPEKVARILGEEPTEQFYEKNFENYDAVIKEGVRSKSQRDAYYYELVNLKREGIVDVPETAIVDALSMSGLSDLKESIEQRDQEKAKQQQLIEEQERVALELANSQKVANLSLSKEREARVLADIGLAQERSSEATSNLADAALARAKTMVELNALDEERMMKVYAFMEQLHGEEKANELEEEKRNDSRAAEIIVKNDIEKNPLSQNQEIANVSQVEGGQEQIEQFLPQ